MNSFDPPVETVMYVNAGESRGCDNLVSEVSGASATASSAFSATALSPFTGLSLISGTTTTGRARLGTHTNAIILGGGDWFLQGIIGAGSLSTVGQEFTSWFGFSDATAAYPGTDGVFFGYDRLNTGNFWTCVTVSNGAATTTTTAVAVTAAAAYNFKIEINAAGTRARFYSGGTLVATHTTNIPTGAGRTTGIGIGALKSAGTTSTTMISLLYILANLRLTNPLWNN